LVRKPKESEKCAEAVSQRLIQTQDGELQSGRWSSNKDNINKRTAKKSTENIASTVNTTSAKQSNKSER